MHARFSASQDAADPSAMPSLIAATLPRRFIMAPPPRARVGGEPRGSVQIATAEGRTFAWQVLAELSPRCGDFDRPFVPIIDDELRGGTIHARRRAGRAASSRSALPKGPRCRQGGSAARSRDGGAFAKPAHSGMMDTFGRCRCAVGVRIGARRLRRRPGEVSCCAPMIRGSSPGAVYQKHCAACCGARLEGGRAGAARRSGRMPAPPHGASGHTWHHGPAAVRHHRTALPAAKLKDYDSAMPAFAGVLSDAEIVAVLSWIKSQWPPEIRRHQRGERRRSTPALTVVARRGGADADQNCGEGPV